MPGRRPKLSVARARELQQRYYLGRANTVKKLLSDYGISQSSLLRYVRGEHKGHSA